MGGFVRGNKRTVVCECLDVGFEIMECLLIYNKPLTEEQIYRYARAWLRAKRKDVTIDNCREAIGEVKVRINLISRCTLPMPRSVIEQVCFCGPTSVKSYNKAIVDPISQMLLDSEMWDEIGQHPKIEQLLERIVPYMINEYN